MSKIGIIIEREYLTRINKKSFIIMTLAIPIVFLALIIGTFALSQIKDSDVKKIAVIDYTGKYGNILRDKEPYQFINVNSDGDASAINYYNSVDKDLYAILTINGDLVENPKLITLYSEKTVNVGLKKDISDQLNPYLSDLKVDSYNIPDLKNILKDASVNVEIETVKWDVTGSETKSSAEMASAVGIIFTMLIYIFIFAYGGMVMQGVMQEKTNRIVEVMVSSVKPFQLMMGKIIGIAFVGLTQFIIWMAMIFGGIMMFGLFFGASSMGDISASGIDQQIMMNQEAMSQLSNTSGIMGDITGILAGINLTRLIVGFLIYFIGGYLLYASLFAAIGSLVDQDADTQQFMLPVTLIIMFAVYAGLYSAENPDGPLAFWCSMVPFTSPIVMMIRLPYDVPFWQLALSVTLLFGTFVGITAVAAKVYRTGILMYGKKVTWKEVAKWLKY